MQNFENNYDMITCDRLFVLDNFKIWGDDKSGFVCGLLPNEQQQNKIKCQTVFGDCHNGDLIKWHFFFCKGVLSYLLLPISCLHWTHCQYHSGLRSTKAKPGGNQFLMSQMKSN